MERSIMIISRTDRAKDTKIRENTRLKDLVVIIEITEDGLGIRCGGTKEDG